MRASACVVTGSGGRLPNVEGSKPDGTVVTAPLWKCTRPCVAGPSSLSASCGRRCLTRSPSSNGSNCVISKAVIIANGSMRTASPPATHGQDEHADEATHPDLREGA